jgi:hypothetical protein
VQIYLLSFLQRPLPTRLLIVNEGEEGMSLQIFVAFTGDRLLADPISFAS